MDPLHPHRPLLAPRARTGALALAGLALAGAATVAWQAARAPLRPVYTGSGYGGYVAASRTEAPRANQAAPARTGEGSKAALASYTQGRYAEADAAARPLVEQAARSGDPEVRKEGARARWVLAFSAARQQELSQAREEFARLREEASELPGGGLPEAGHPLGDGEDAPTLEEDAAYQHAVLTAALGQPGAAEEEFKAFMHRYPESPLVHASIRRIARLHGGDVPKDAEAGWQEAKRVAKAREQARERERSKCAPEVLAELLRRREGRGESSIAAEVENLAREMGTSHEGTSLKALAAAAKKRGYSPKGLKLTWTGLGRQKLPVVALVQPGHFVLVERLASDAIETWDPDGGGEGRPGPRRYSLNEWLGVWNGIALALE